MSDNNRFDIEEILRKQRVGPGAGVKRTVVGRYQERVGSGAKVAGPFWRRPVPLYAAVAAVITALIIALPLQYRLLPRSDEEDLLRSAPESPAVVDAPELEWNSAPADLI